MTFSMAGQKKVTF